MNLGVIFLPTLRFPKMFCQISSIQMESGSIVSTKLIKLNQINWVGGGICACYPIVPGGGIGVNSINLVTPEILKDARYQAHSGSVNGMTTKAKETLLAHSELTIHCYRVYCQYKDMEEIIKRLIASCGFQGEEAESVYLLYLYAIYLHDFGKINPLYQYKVLDNQNFKN